MGLRLFSLAIIILTSMVVSACGGGSGSDSSSLSQNSTVTIQGSGIKGILANATVSIYELNTSLALSYDPALPIATGVTDSVGRFASLEISTNISKPLVLVVNGASSIDLNSNQTPVITNLTSIFTIEDALAGNPIFATPYTTIAHEMAKSNSTSRSSDAAFRNNFVSAITDVGTALGFGTSENVNFLTTPAVLSEAMASQAQQAAIIQHRAAIEALAAVIVELRTASGNTLSSGDIVKKLADDLFNDGQIDGDSGLDISAIPANVENLYVPGTQVQIKDIGIILESDRQYTGVNTNSVRSLSPSLTAPTLTIGDNRSIGNNGGSTGNNNGTPEPVIFLSTGTINFGSVAVGSVSAAMSLTLTNTGNAPLTLENISVSNEFSQTNNCNGYVPAGDSCIISISFIPVSSGNKTGELAVTGTIAGRFKVALLGVGDNGSSQGNHVLYVDFEHLPIGKYAEADARSDFDIHTLGYKEPVRGPDRGSVDIVLDPANSGHGKVMRSVRHAGFAGQSTKAGGFSFRADLPPADEYYFAYDFYVPSNFWQPLQHKMPGMINGTLLEASHSATEVPNEDGLSAFTALMQSHSSAAFGRGDGSMAAYIYDKDDVQSYDWLNIVNPESEAVAGQYQIPRGQWVKIEQYMKLNTVNIKDGELKIWVDGVLVSDQLHRWRADSNFGTNQVSNADRQIDGIWMYDFYGGNLSDPRNQSPQLQYHYYDNFVVSSSPITH